MTTTIVLLPAITAPDSASLPAVLAASSSLVVVTIALVWLWAAARQGASGPHTCPVCTTRRRVFVPHPWLGAPFAAKCPKCGTTLAIVAASARLRCATIWILSAGIPLALLAIGTVLAQPDWKNDVLPKDLRPDSDVLVGGLVLLVLVWFGVLATLRAWIRAGTKVRPVSPGKTKAAKPGADPVAVGRAEAWLEKERQRDAARSHRELMEQLEKYATEPEARSISDGLMTGRVTHAQLVRQVDLVRTRHARTRSA